MGLQRSTSFGPIPVIRVRSILLSVIRSIIIFTDKEILVVDVMERILYLGQLALNARHLCQLSLSGSILVNLKLASLYSTFLDPFHDCLH